MLLIYFTIICHVNTFIGVTLVNGVGLEGELPKQGGKGGKGKGGKGKGGKGKGGEGPGFHEGEWFHEPAVRIVQQLYNNLPPLDAANVAFQNAVQNYRLRMGLRP